MPTGSGGGGNGTPDAGSSASAYFRVNGVDEWQNDFRLNGINDNIEIYGGNYTGINAAILPPPYAIYEFTLQSGDFNAEFGHSTGGIINASIKSGTNGVHGDAWEYVRNNDLNANYFFNRTCSNGVADSQTHSPDQHQNLFGFTAGGPVIIPGVVHGNSRLSGSPTTRAAATCPPVPDGGLTVPTAGMRQVQLHQSPDRHRRQLQRHLQRHGHHRLQQRRTGCAFSAGHHHGSSFTPACSATFGTDPVPGLTGTPGAPARHLSTTARRAEAAPASSASPRPTSHRTQAALPSPPST